MEDNVIKVSVRPNKQNSVKVSSNVVSTPITANSDTSQLWSQVSKNWAVSENIVDNTDYSSKYYANKAKENATAAQGISEAVKSDYNEFLTASLNANEQLQTGKEEALTSLESARADAENSINNTKTTAISDIEFVADGEKKEIEDLIDSGKEELKESIGDVKVLTTLKIGQIGIAPLGIDETLNMERYLNGQIIIQDQFKGFTQFLKKRVTLYPSIACLEDEWQNIVANSDFNQCGKFVIDDNAGTIRLPKVVNIQGLTDLSKLGEIVEAGLPNIEGVAEGVMFGGATTTSGALQAYTTNFGSQASNSTNLNRGLVLDASNSNPIYSKSNTVQQEQIQYPYFIQVATGAETEDNIINEIELNNPYSFGDSKYSPKPLNNLSWLKSEGQWNSKAVYPSYYDWTLTNFNNGVEGFALSTGEYTDYDVVINPADETFRLPLLNGSESLPSDRYDELILGVSGTTYTAPANGWYILYKQANSPTSSTLDLFCTLTNASTGITSHFHGAYGFGLTPCVEVKKGDNVFVTYDATGITQYFRFVYAQGNGSLYFYVGETVQNANLINAGRIEETLANKQDKCIHIIDTYVNGTSGYRIWSDGYCEQWGNYQGTNITNHVINLLINFKDTTYITFANTNYITGLQRGVAYTVNTNKTVGHFQIYSADFAPGQLNCDWLACGYIR